MEIPALALEQLRMAAIQGNTLVWTPVVWSEIKDERDPTQRERTAFALLHVHMIVVQLSQLGETGERLTDAERVALKEWCVALLHHAQQPSRRVLEHFARPLLEWMDQL